MAATVTGTQWPLVCARAAFFVALAAILWLTLTSAGSAPLVHDKIAHASAFFVLGLLGLHSWPENAPKVIVALAGVGAGIEILQGILPIQRDFEFLDWLADIAGIVAAFALWRSFHGRRLRTE